MSKKIGFVGFGLIGGSIAHAIKEAHQDYKLIATSRTLAPLEQALSDGVLDEVISSIDSNFSDCDYIFLCAPVVTITKNLAQLKPIISESCIITDVGSVKDPIHKAVEELDMEASFIGGHPMTGKEVTGYANSSSDILKGARYVITPTKKTTKESLDEFTQLVLDMNAVPFLMEDYSKHDEAVACISHIPHLIAAGLAMLTKHSDGEEEYMHKLAAGSFKDVTRVAASSPEMWDQIITTNKEQILIMLDKYIEELNKMKNEISSDTPNYVSQLFEEARDYRKTF